VVSETTMISRPVQVDFSIISISGIDVDKRCWFDRKCARPAASSPARGNLLVPTTWVRPPRQVRLGSLQDIDAIFATAGPGLDRHKLGDMAWCCTWSTSWPTAIATMPPAMPPVP
jgi:hypothetical protein